MQRNQEGKPGMERPRKGWREETSCCPHVTAALPQWGPLSCQPLLMPWERLRGLWIEDPLPEWDAQTFPRTGSSSDPTPPANTPTWAAWRLRELP